MSSKITDLVEQEDILEDSFYIETDNGTSSNKVAVENILRPDQFGFHSNKSPGILFPLYIYPTAIYTNATYNAIIDLAKTYRKVPIICILNPSSGPGVAVDANYTVAIQRLQGANITVIGYVSTAYTVTSLATVKADIDLWKSLYPGIQGIFFDEMTYEDNQTYIDYYIELNKYAKSKRLFITIANPGAPFSMKYLDQEASDIIVGWESDDYPSLVQKKEDYADGAFSYNLNRRAALVHSIANYSSAEAIDMWKYYGWLFITDDVLPNPWDAVTSYLENMLSDSLSSSVKFKITQDGGYAIKLTNKTGGLSVKGEIVTPDATVDNAVSKIVVDVPNPIGVFYESNVADGDEAWIVVSGIADVYFVGNSTRSHIARGFLTADGGSYVTGQALSEAVPTSPFAVDKHFYEIGHVIESRVGAGLAKCILHFN